MKTADSTLGGALDTVTQGGRRFAKRVAEFFQQSIFAVCPPGDDMEGKQRSRHKPRAPGTDLVRIRLPSPPATSPRRARRRPVAGILVVIEAPALSAQHWVADAFDISSDGMGLVLPPALPLSTELLLSFRLDEEYAFSRVPAEIRHRDPVAGGGGVRFGAWPEDDRLRLLEHLATH